MEQAIADAHEHRDHAVDLFLCVALVRHPEVACVAGDDQVFGLPCEHRIATVRNVATLAKYHNNQTTFGFRMYRYQEELTDSHVYTETRARDRDEAKAFDFSLASAMSQLTTRECMVIRARYGLFGDDCRTLEETGKPLKISRERVRKIESKALKKLQHYTLADTLKPFYPLVPNPEEFYQCETE